MGSLDEDLCGDTRRIIRIQEETIDSIALPETADLPPEALLALLKRFQLDDERSLIGTRAGNEVITLNLLTALNGRIGSQDRVHLVDDLTRAGHRGSRWHRDSTEHRACILIGHQTALRGEHRHNQHSNTDYHRDDDSHRLAYQFL